MPGTIKPGTTRFSPEHKKSFNAMMAGTSMKDRLGKNELTLLHFDTVAFAIG